ncbi:MAG: DNA repair protein RecN [Rhodocyclaceae bacterium]|nr:DNA repair protein RecN [Rhodocyclaceae bacterium]
MLRRVLIRDYVIVDRLELDFSAGFGTLTGETGAGKSILVDALSLALGERADALVVRQGRDKAEISAEFDLPAGGPLATWLKDNDFDTEGDACLLRRVVDASGRSRAYVNGTPATLTQLKEAGAFLADIHGQHQHHALLRVDAQRKLLDSHGGLSDLARRVAERHKAWRGAREARLAAEKNAAGSAREREMLEWQAQELKALGFEPRQWLDDNQEFNRLSHAATLLEGVAAACDMLDEGEAAVLPQVESAAVRLSTLAEYDPALEDARELLQGAQVQLDEALHALRRYRDRLEMDPERLSALERRIGAVESVAKKHRIPPDDLPGLLDDTLCRLAQLEECSDPAALAEREALAQEAFRTLAAELSAGRQKVAEALSSAVTDAMQDMAMAGGRFQVALSPLADGALHGLEDVEFLVAANPNQPLRPLAKVASGGELSRIGLAIQVITSRSGETPTLLFDEVDVGIGGRVAEIVGRRLRELGRERQVLCVTHLPQVAARADWQWNISKETVAGEVLSRVHPLDRGGRVGEIARMLGGMKITETTRKHAEEMLDAPAP